ncbi:MAG: InlB B-repeat-containing protein [Lachnospiraceae bacterium]|nr:InlB B-repeat-containing protein [Lachnospiraceae bacterium]
MNSIRHTLGKPVAALLLAIALLAGTAAAAGTAKAGSTAKPWKITFYANGGYRSSDGKQTVEVNTNLGSTIHLLTGFVRPGFTFLGWSTDPHATTAQYAPNQRVTVGPSFLLSKLYAVWKPNLITITYKPGSGVTLGGHYGLTQTYTYGTTLVLHPPVCSKPGYSLVGWNTKPDGSGTMYHLHDTNIQFAYDTTLYAIWAKVVGYHH